MDYSRVLRLPQYFRNLQRLGEIVRVLIKHGFGDLVDRLQLRPYLETSLRVFRPSLGSVSPGPSLDLAARMRLVCEELGPTFIKFAQLVGTRPDVFPFNIVVELRKLHDKVPPFPADQARAVVAAELGRPIEDIFSQFEDQPLAAASIAQVHRAMLHDGSKVVLKIQRPSVDRVIETDMDILRGLATLIEENIPESRQYRPLELIEEFARTLRRECDFRREASNIRKFAENFSQERGVRVPKVWEEYSTRRVLVEECIEGFKADDLGSLRQAGIDGTKVVPILTRALLKSVFEDRFFHADPHPGNILITPQGEIAMLDFGAMGRLDRSRVRFILQFLVAIFSRDLDKMVRVLNDSQYAPTDLDEVSLKSQVSEIIDNHLGNALGRLDLSRMLADIFEVVHRYGIQPSADLLLVGKSLTTLEAIGAELDPAFRPFEVIQPYLVQRYFAALTDTKAYRAYVAEVSGAYRRLLSELPVQLRILMRALANGSFSLNASSRDLAALIKHQNAMINRALMTVIGVCLVALGVGLGVHADSGWWLGGAYACTVLGILVLLTVWLSIRRTGGMS